MMVMACQYFMLVFACDITDENLRASLGFNFSMLVLAHLIIGFLALIITKFIKKLPTIKKAWIKVKEYWHKLKEKLCNRAKKTPEDIYSEPPPPPQPLNDIEKAEVKEHSIEEEKYP